MQDGDVRETDMMEGYNKLNLPKRVVDHMFGGYNMFTRFPHLVAIQQIAGNPSANHNHIDDDRIL